KRCHFLDVLFESFSAGTRGERWSTLFPRVTHQTETVVLHGLAGLRSYKNRVPACVLFDSEWSLVQTISHLWSRAEIVVIPVVCRDFLRPYVWQSTRHRNRSSCFDKSTSAHISFASAPTARNMKARGKCGAKRSASPLVRYKKTAPR